MVFTGMLFGRLLLKFFRENILLFLPTYGFYSGTSHDSKNDSLAGSTLVGVAALALCSLLLLGFYYVFYLPPNSDTLSDSLLLDKRSLIGRLAPANGIRSRRPENSLWKNNMAGSLAGTLSRYNTVSTGARSNAQHAQPGQRGQHLQMQPQTDAENNVYKSANLNASPVGEAVLRLSENVGVDEGKLTVSVKDSQKEGEVIELRIFYRETRPPSGHHTKGEILLLHGQAFTSANWLEHRTMQILAAAGYRVCAVDLPGYGQTSGRVLTKEEKPWLLAALIEALSLRRPVVVSPSMSGAYSVPYFMSVEGQHRLSAFVPVAPVGVTEYKPEEYEANEVPTLMIYGERDTSLGVLAAAHLRPLANGRVYKVPAAGHACYLNNPDVFHAAMLNFLDLVRTHGHGDGPNR